MKMSIKKALCLILVLTLVCTTLLAFTACNDKPVVQTDTETVIVITKAYFEQGDTLEKYMDRLVEKGKLTYAVDNGMITSVNGVEAKASENRYWLIYTSDTEYANTSWGTYEYDGKTYGSATLGIKELPVKEGEVYVFAISQF